MNISIVIPVYNEASRVEAVLESVLRQPLAGGSAEIIAVDDGSRDRTPELLRRYADRIRIITHPVNCGKGAAVRTGVMAAGGDTIIIQDADLEYDPADLPALLSASMDGTRVVFGARRGYKGYRPYVWGMRFLTAVTNICFGSRLTDVLTGYKVLPAALARSLQLRSQGFAIEVEIAAKILARGISITEIPIHYHPRTFQEGKKIRAIDGFYCLLAIIRYRLTA